MEQFWRKINGSDSEGHVIPQEIEVAYVLPADYGFGFRNPTDTIWGLFPADTLSTKVWSDVQILAGRYSSFFDIVYDETLYRQDFGRYNELFFWNQTIG